MKKVLGYPSQAVAISALKKKGLHAKKIAERLGITYGHVVTVLSQNKNGDRLYSLKIPLDVIIAYHEEAKRRRMDVSALVARVLRGAMETQMIDKLLKM